MKWPSKGRMVWLFLAVVLLVPVAGLAVLSLLSSPPKNLGVVEGRLLDCPQSPNCVCTQASDAGHRMDAIPFTGTADQAMRRLEAVLRAQPRTKIVTRTENYIHAEATSRLFRFVDDVEFFVDPASQQIHFRSASRAGHSDLGANRARMQTIAEAFNSTP